jgi:diguanylate cyclase (GGDEF)-like protein
VARYGGEEFSVLLPYASKDVAYQVSERIRKAIESTTIVAYDETQKVTVSIGISVFPDDSRELAELISNSDKALYDSKRKGRNKLPYSPESVNYY